MAEQKKLNIKLGKKYRDSVTGFEGVATAELKILGDTPNDVRLETYGNVIWFPIGRIEEIPKATKAKPAPKALKPRKVKADK